MARFRSTQAVMNFASDTVSPAHPAILAALAEANSGMAPSYGADGWTELARKRLEDVFEIGLDIWLVSSGTAANALALSLLCPSTGAVACHAEAHVERDERGAPEFYMGGGKLSLLLGDHARLDIVELERRLKANSPDFVHETPLHAVSISNLTESGAAYTAAQTEAVAELAKAHGLRVHLDGARFANAVASMRARPADLSWRAGVDVMSFGATKNGALGCEAIILFGEARALLPQLKIRAKRGGHMPPKMRFLGAQMAAYLEGGLWLDLARRANDSARRLGAVLVAAGGQLAHPVDGNEVFARLPEAMAARLTEARAGFYPWLDGSHRFVCSWATSQTDIDQLMAVVSAKK